MTQLDDLRAGLVQSGLVKDEEEAVFVDTCVRELLPRLQFVLDTTRPQSSLSSFISFSVAAVAISTEAGVPREHALALFERILTSAEELNKEEKKDVEGTGEAPAEA